VSTGARIRQFGRTWGNRKSMAENLLLIGLGVALLTGIVATLVIAGGARREVRSISKALEESYSQLATELERARQDALKAQQKIQQLEEGRPEKLEWELRQATEALERWQQAHSEIQQELGQQKQELLHQSAQQEQQRLRLEKESHNLMEELERWRWRFVNSQQEAEGLRQELSEYQQKVEQLTQLRERLLEELRGIGNR
jgi:chromosome segregation ATPase